MATKKPLLLAEKLTTNEFLAAEFVSLRLEQFQKLSVRVRKLILEIVLYYLNTFYPFENAASNICSDIIVANATNNELLMAECYKRFLEFLPIGVRSGIQGRNLFKQPSEVEKVMAHFYVNDLDSMQKYNRDLYTPDEAGITMRDRILLMQATLEQELGLAGTEDIKTMGSKEFEIASP